MKLRALAVGLVLLGLTGCFEYDETFTLNADGSGSLSLEQTIDLSFEDELRKIKGNEGVELGDLGIPTADEIKKDLAAIEGITLKRCEVETKAKRTHVRLGFDFKSLHALREIEGFSDRRLELVEDGDKVTVKYVFDGKKFFGGSPFEGSGKESKGADDIERKTMAVLEQAREKARMKVTLRLPAAPLETSAKAVEGDAKAVLVEVLGKPGSKPKLGTGEDIVITAVLPKSALEKALAAEKAAKPKKKRAGE